MAAMSITDAAREFLAQKRIAVAGVSRDPKQAKLPKVELAGKSR